MFPFFASLKTNTFELSKREGNLALLRNTILGYKHKFRFTGWTKHNLLKAIRRRRTNKYAIVVIDLYRSTAGDICVHLSSEERLKLVDLVDELQNAEYPWLFLIFYCERVDRYDINLLLADENRLTCLFVHRDSNRFAFSLACELVNWWGLKTIKYQNVSFQYIESCFVVIVTNYGRAVGESSFDYKFMMKTTSSELRQAWFKGRRLDAIVDIETLQSDARHEQVADTIKRVIDYAFYIRQQHYQVCNRLKSSQGLLWLSELDEEIDIKNWIEYTRLMSDVNSHSLHIPIVELTQSKDVDIEVLQVFLREFIQIPAGFYVFGTEMNDNLSEPPAKKTTAYIETFSISKSPITEKLWATLIDSSNMDKSNLPKVHVDYFEAMRFAEILTDVITVHFPNEMSGMRIVLPTEYQWESASRGSDGLNYPWGDQFEIGCCNCEMYIGERTEVGKYSPKGDSEFGCLDMSGNVREWTRSYAGIQGLDWQLHSVDKIKTQDAFNYIDSGSRMIIKGGSYSYSSECVRTWVRNTQIACRKDSQTGFRLVLEKKKSDAKPII